MLPIWLLVVPFIFIVLEVRKQYRRVRHSVELRKRFTRVIISVHTRKKYAGESNSVEKHKQLTLRQRRAGLGYVGGGEEGAWL